MCTLPTGMAHQIASNLKWFGLLVSHEQACCLAEIYLTHRAYFHARDVAESMVGLQTLPWPWFDITPQECTLMMGILVDRLDRQYWADTFEHDSEAARV
jgi:hypothetical protein